MTGWGMATSYAGDAPSAPDPKILSAAGRWQCRASPEESRAPRAVPRRSEAVANRAIGLSERRRAREPQRHAGRRVIERQRRRVQHHARGGIARAAVERIADDRAAEGGEMHAQLVRAAGDRLERHAHV